MFSINVRSQSMTSDTFVSYVESCVIKSGVPPQALCFDVTERFAASGSISVGESLRRLEALGCEVALDDFGAIHPHTGTCARCRRITSRSTARLVGAAPTDKVARAMISAIVRMAGDLGIQTVAESVELDVSSGGALARRRLRAGLSAGRAQIAADFDFKPVATS